MALFVMFLVREKQRTIARMIMVLVILQSSIKSTGYGIGRVDFPLSKLLLFENKKTENIRPRKNADCTECSIVLLKNEYGAKISEFVGGGEGDALAECLKQNQKSVHSKKAQNIRTLQNN
jgi:hypothetical protein